MNDKKETELLIYRRGDNDAMNRSIAQRTYRIIAHIFMVCLCIAMCSVAPVEAGQIEYNVADYAAVGDGKTLNTQAIQQAIDQCAADGGGTVILPAGIYLSGTLVLKDNVRLHISEGAVLLGSKQIKDYKEFRPAIPSYNDGFLRYSLIYAEDAVNIAVTGGGKIDGQGSAFVVKTKKRPDRYMNRPYVIRFVNCKRVRVENVKMMNSAMWMQHYFACENVRIHGIDVYNHCNRNNDMIDIDGCKNVIVSHCIGDTDDDAMTIKSTSGIMSENITITNCVLSSHCNAIKCGTESHAGFRNITISNCVVKPSAHPSHIYGYPSGIGGIVLGMVDGGVMDGIVISNIRIDGAKVPIFMRLGDRARVYKEGMSRPPVGQFMNIRISDVSAAGADTIGCAIAGLPGHPIQNISLSNISIAFKGGVELGHIQEDVPELPDHYPESTMFGRLPAYGFYVRHGQNISLSHINLTCEKPDHRPALVCDDVKGLDVTGLKAAGSMKQDAMIKLTDVRDAFITDSRAVNDLLLFVSVSGELSDGITLSGNDIHRAKNMVRLSGEASESAVKVLQFASPPADNME